MIREIALFPSAFIALAAASSAAGAFEPARSTSAPATSAPLIRISGGFNDGHRETGREYGYGHCRAWQRECSERWYPGSWRFNRCVRLRGC